MKRSLPIVLLSVSVFGYAVLNVQKPKTSTAKINFGRDVVPILSQKCYKCHGPDAAKAAANLRLDLLSSRAITKGSPDKSLLIHRVSDKNPGSRMPPEDSGVKPLKESEIAILRQWISQGATYEKHWSYVPPTMPSLPKVSNSTWSRNPLDRLILAKLESSGLKPEPEADRDTLA
ncbi:MAG: c-type cytochrome domain-containing protein, partial [Armatimonadota bacterium]